MDTNPTIVPVEGLGEAAAAAQNLAIQQEPLSPIGPLQPPTTLGMYPPDPFPFSVEP